MQLDWPGHAFCCLLGKQLWPAASVPLQVCLCLILREAGSTLLVPAGLGDHDPCLMRCLAEGSV